VAITFVDTSFIDANEGVEEAIDGATGPAHVGTVAGDYQLAFIATHVSAPSRAQDGWTFLTWAQNGHSSITAYARNLTAATVSDPLTFTWRGAGRALVRTYRGPHGSAVLATGAGLVSPEREALSRLVRVWVAATDNFSVYPASTISPASGMSNAVGSTFAAFGGLAAADDGLGSDPARTATTTGSTPLYTQWLDVQMTEVDPAAVASYFYVYESVGITAIPSYDTHLYLYEPVNGAVHSAPSNPLNLTDTLQIYNPEPQLSETFGLTDTVVGVLVTDLPASDDLALTDTFSALTFLSVDAVDLVGLSESSLLTDMMRGFNKQDPVGLTDASSRRTYAKERTYVDNVGLKESTYRSELPVDEVLGLTETTLVELWPEGDLIATPIVISGASGTHSFNTVGSHREPGEPDDSAGTGEAGTIWFRYDTPSEAGSLVLTTTAPTDWNSVIEVYEGTSLADIGLVDYGDDDPDTGTTLSRVSMSTSPDTTYLIRVHGFDASQEVIGAELDWAYTPRVASILLAVTQDQVPTTPGNVVVNVMNAQPNSMVNFDVVTDTTTYSDVYQGMTDSTGALIGFSVPIAQELTAGSYQLVANIGADAASSTFFVLADPPVRPSPPPVIVYPPWTPPEVQVNRWVVLDGVTSWTFPMNPTEKTTPHAPRVYTTEHSVSPSGQHITWEGSGSALEWTLTGYLNTQAFYEKLEALVNSNQRYAVIDNRKRRYEVSFESFDPEYRRSYSTDGSLNDWSFNYTLVLFVYSGPVYIT
jgi:hypothetical protein